MATLPIERFSYRWRLGDGGCWEWTGALDRGGYGSFMIHYKDMSAHRASWELFRGAIPAGKWVLHKCDNPRCVNPEHLFLGTAADNARDAATKGRALSGDKWRAVKRNLPNGDAHPMSKISSKAAMAIRNSKLSGYKLGQLFGISATQARRIKKGESWKYL